jgi:hypothetical protein
MIVSMHIAIGAAAGGATGSRRLAVLLGPLLHVAADRVRHEDIPDRRFEIVSGVVCVAVLAARRGPLDPVVLGAAASSAPDVEHVVPWLRPRGRKLFHRRPQLAGGIGTCVQLLVAGVVVGALLASPSRPRWKHARI